VFAFIHSAILILIAGAEFISFVLMIVYVGAVAVLILFVVMMLDLKSKKIQEKFNYYFPIVLGVSAFLLAEIIALAYYFAPSNNARDILVYPRPSRTENIIALGQHIYTHYAFIFQISGMILFVAMIGAIVLTLNNKTSYVLKRQNPEKQIKRSKENSLVLTTPESGKGITQKMINGLKINFKEEN
jgi:NADH-quinone oxidoreductase subunit J